MAACSYTCCVCASAELSKAETDAKYSALVPSCSGLCNSMARGTFAVAGAFFVRNVGSKMWNCEHHQEIPSRLWVNNHQWNDFLVTIPLLLCNQGEWDVKEKCAIKYPYHKNVTWTVEPNMNSGKYGFRNLAFVLLAERLCLPGLANIDWLDSSTEFVSLKHDLSLTAHLIFKKSTAIVVKKEFPFCLVSSRMLGLCAGSVFMLLLEYLVALSSLLLKAVQQRTVFYSSWVSWPYLSLYFGSVPH